MKILSRINKLLAAGILVFVSSQAYATAYNLSSYAWAYDSDRDGDISSSEVISDDSFSFEGYTLVTVETNSGTASLDEGATFTDYTYLTNTQTGVYSVAKLTGSIAAGSSKATFDDSDESESSMTWYSSTGTQILTLDVVSTESGVAGHSLLDVEGSTLYVGQVTLYLSIDTVEPGYFYIYIEGEGWVDFATLIANGDTLELSSVTTSSSASDGDISDEILDILEDIGSGEANYAGVDNGSDLIDLTAAYQEDGVYSYALAHNGGIHVDSSAVPEPGMLSLMGLAFLGLAGFQRRRNKKQMEL